jgi:hypothetical protein
MTAELEKSDDALRSALIVAARHIRHQKYDKQSGKVFQRRDCVT